MDVPRMRSSSNPYPLFLNDFYVSSTTGGYNLTNCFINSTSQGLNYPVTSLLMQGVPKTSPISYPITSFARPAIWLGLGNAEVVADAP
jgi:hypothetical protein